MVVRKSSSSNFLENGVKLFGYGVILGGLYLKLLKGAKVAPLVTLKSTSLSYTEKLT